MKLSAKYGLVISTAAVVTAAALSALMYYGVRNVLEAQAVKAELEAADRILGKIDEALSQARRAMTVLSEDEFLEEFVSFPAYRNQANHDLLETELEERAEITGLWDDVMVVDREGKYLLATIPHDSRADFMDDPVVRAAFNAALAGEVYQSGLVVSDHSGRPTLIFAAPVPGRTQPGEEEGVAGVLVAQYRWSVITDILNKGFQGGSVYLFDRDGSLLAGHVPGQETLLSEYLEHHAKVQRALVASGERQTVHSGANGDAGMLSVHVAQAAGDSAGARGWGLAIEQPANVVFAPARALARDAAFAVIGMLAILTIALTVLGYRLTQPLVKLTRITREIGQGNLGRRIDYESSDEVGALTTSFNAMVDQLEAGHAALMEAKNRIQTIVDTVPGILYSAAPEDFAFTFVSPAAGELLGYSYEELIGDPSLRSSLLVDEDRKRAFGEIVRAREDDSYFVVNYRMRHKDGQTVRWFEDRGSWAYDSKGRAVAVHGVMTDVTERKQAEEQLARTTRALDILHIQDRLLTRANTEMDLVKGACVNIVDEQAYQFAWVGLIDREDPRHLHVVAHAGSDAPFVADLRNADLDIEKSDCLPCEAVRKKRPYMVQNLAEFKSTDEMVLRALAHHYSSLISLPLISEDEVIGSLNVYSRDVNVFDDAELKLLKEIASNLAFGIFARRTRELHNRAREQLAHQAFHDALTGLPNREMFIQNLEAAIAHAEKTGEVLEVLLVDLDDFKLVNDTLGHAAGDELLRQVGERIAASIRGSDLVARQGGDEFIVLMGGGKADSSRGPSNQGSLFANAASHAQRLVDRLKEPYVIEGNTTYIGTSIGIATYPDDARDPYTLLRYADSAMYRAKELGRGGYAFYSAHLTERQQQRMSMANRLHQALEKGEFLLHYQPVIDLATGAVRGVEALLRWQDDKGELVPPGEFLPIAEDTGLIIPIGEWVLREACHQTKTWLADGLELLVAVNISARQLWHGDVADEILQTIAETGVSSESLELEITETAMGSDPRHMESALVRFHKGGLKIALDDFGTGYSSLSRLKHLPIHTLKIDQSFVDGIPDDEDDTAIVTATMQLAHSLGLRSLAEGIETKEQWEWLRKRGCQYGQGYYFSRPVPATDIPKLLERAQRGWPPE